MSLHRVLVVDDSAASSLAEQLGGVAFIFESAAGAAQAAARLSADPPDVLVVDLDAMDVDGLDTIMRIDPTVAVVVMAGPEARDRAVEAMRRGAFQYLVKPFQMQALRLLLERACREKALRQENGRLRRTIERRSSIPQVVEQLVLDEPMTLAMLERRYIEAVVERAGGDEARAAALLGIDLSTLQRRRAGGDR